MREQAPIHLMKTYVAAVPLATHWRRATCEEVQCGAFLRGWRTTVAYGSDKAEYIRKHSGRRFTETRDEVLAVFEFEPGQQCFAASEHRLPLERDPIFRVRDGDRRGNPSGRVITFPGARDFVDDFAENMQSVAEMHQKGN